MKRVLLVFFCCLIFAATYGQESKQEFEPGSGGPDGPERKTKPQPPPIPPGYLSRMILKSNATPWNPYWQITPETKRLMIEMLDPYMIKPYTVSNIGDTVITFIPAALVDKGIRKELIKRIGDRIAYEKQYNRQYNIDAWNAIASRLSKGTHDRIQFVINEP